MATLRDELKRRAPDAELRVFDELIDRGADAQMSATGAYIDGIVAVALNSASPEGTLAHEVIHHLRRTGRFGQQASCHGHN